eukprot:TRINITY_DN47103_c0_g1_i1.p1 TRINITY_DN47103_c0_g1~~TRINITY_DN47103_c0_g1_i1.p1  ORF type:complete len:535 (-),score=99.92 TRINITY_DN47103_c0_g1_i1:49-1629(-)
MDPELLSKLTRRLRVIEGADAAQSAQVEASELTPRLGPRSKVQVPSWIDAEARQEPAPHLGRRRKVQVPSWVVDTVEATNISPAFSRQVTPSNKSTASSSTARSRCFASGRSQAASSQQENTPPSQRCTPSNGAASGAACSQQEQCEAARRLILRKAQLERDTAQRHVEEAEAAARSWAEDLASEAQRLRHSLATLRGQHSAATGQVSCLQHRDSIGADGWIPGAPGDQLAPMQRKVQNLGIELFDLEMERGVLQARSDALTAELERQESSCAELLEKVEAKRQAQSEMRAEITNIKHASADSASLQAPRRMSSLPSTVRPPADERFSLDAHPGMESSMSTDEPKHGEYEAANDLEFAYDWGLELSTKMSIGRALQLARWAAARGSNSVSGPEDFALVTEGSSINADEQSFEVPLAELQDALSVLQNASAVRRSGASMPADRKICPEPTDLSAFQSPIQELQKVLLELGGRGPKLGQVIPAHLASSNSNQGHCEDLSAFQAPIEDLQKVLLRLGGGNSPELAPAVG